jgi:hypothetical protein
MSDTAIKLFRGILESQVFAHPTALKIWIWCLCKASYKERFIPLKIGKGQITIKLLPGQFIFGRFKAEEELNIDGSTIYKWMQRFASPLFEMITIESNNQYSIITICKWNEYQINGLKKVTTKEQPKNNQRTAEEQPKNTNNNVYNVYNDFYDAEILKSEKDPEYIKVVDALFGKNNLGTPLNIVLKMETQLSYEQFTRLMVYKKKYSFSIVNILESMENWGNPKKYKTVYSTFQTFLKNELKVKSL